MIFRPELVEKILAGQKTETRRVVKYRDGQELPCRYKEGRDYALQPGRTKPGVARIRVLEVRREHLGQMTHFKAIAEGFSGTGEFFRYWEKLHGRAEPSMVEVWVLRFELAEQS